MKIMDESILFFSRVSLSKFSLELATIRGYKEYLYWCMFGIRKVSFSQTEWSGDLASRLD